MANEGFDVLAGLRRRLQGDRVEVPEETGITINLFVYGTLKRGYGLQHLLMRAGARYLGDAKTEAGYTLYGSYGIPCLVKQEGASGVKGEVYQLDFSQIGPIDRVESAYQRVPVKLVEGPVRVAQAYLSRWMDREDQWIGEEFDPTHAQGQMIW